MVASVKRLVQKIQNFVCEDPDPDLEKTAQRFGVPVGFVEQCMETDDLAVLQRHYTSSQSSKPKIKTAGEKKDKPAETNGHTPQPPDYQPQQLPAQQPISAPEPALPSEPTTGNGLETTVATALASPDTQTVSDESATDLEESVSGRPSPYDPKNAKSIPIKREAKYQKKEENKNPISQIDIPRLQAIVGSVPAETFRAQMYGKLEGLFTELQASFRLWDLKKYTEVFVILGESPSGGAEIKRQAGLRIHRLASFLGANLDIYERVLTSSTNRLSSRETADNLSYFASMKGELERIREMKEQALDIDLLNRSELVQK